MARRGASPQAMTVETPDVATILISWLNRASRHRGRVLIASALAFDRAAPARLHNNLPALLGRRPLAVRALEEPLRTLCFTLGHNNLTR